MAGLPPAPPRSKRVVVVVGVLAALVVASLVVYLQTGSQPGTPSGQTFAGTITTTFTNPCSTSSFPSTSSATTGVQQAGRDFGPLLGNFSAMAAALYTYSSIANSVTTSSFTVLNRSSSASGGRYEVNITTTQEVSTSASSTVSPLSSTTRGSFLGVISQSGSVLSIETTSGTVIMGSGGPLFLFHFQLDHNFSAANSQVRTINTTTITIGSTTMSVTDYQLPVQDTVVVQEGCGGQPAKVNSTTISHWVVQAGRVPGTDFTLVTRYNQFSSIQSSSTGSSGLTLTEEVTGFTVA